jgi:MoxR-like ATPase
MNQTPLLPYYTGNPRAPRDPDTRLPVPDSDNLTDPEHYLASPELAAAVNVAIELGMPLLLTGDPGCGKSRLADSVACELGLNRDQKGVGRALRFTVKSDTEGRDLFYRFDTLGRFHASQHDKNPREPREFITFNPLGKAILRAKGKREALRKLMRDGDWNDLPDQPERNVVLIDEIDKAPREVPNDLLSEIENLSFTIPELFHHAEVCLEDDDKPFRPIVVITSNSERDLPPAFLRRCIYFHLELPPYGDPKGHTEKGEH